MNKFFELIAGRVALRIPIWILLIIPFIAYLCWEYYWYTKVGLRVIKWHTHVLEYVYVWIVGIFIFQLLKKRDSEGIKNAFLLFTSIVFSLGLLETFLEISGLYKTYMEKVSGDYSSPYTPQDQTYYHLWDPSKPHWLTKPEYSYWRPTNSQGVGDREWSTQRKPKEKRIMALGDSFTEGDGAPYDSSYVSLLNKKLLAAGDTFYVMNAGVCGSDPFNNFILLRDRLLIYKPDIILQVLASNDMTTDILLRGGMERFQEDGTLKYRPAPWWEPLYAVSYISRIVITFAGYNELLKKDTINSSDQNELNEKTSDLFRQYARLSKTHKMRLIVILRPDWFEIEKNQYAYDFSFIRSQLKEQGIETLDLLPRYREYIAAHHSEAKNYFWPKDGHHNPTGYEMMAQTIYENLSHLLTDSATEESR